MKRPQTRYARSGELAIIPAADAVKEFTDLVPDAVFREIPGNSGFIFGLDIGLIADIFEEFITGSAPAGVTNRILSTVLFTDLVDSTRRAALSGTGPGRICSTATSIRSMPRSARTAARRSNRPATEHSRCSRGRLRACALRNR